MKYYAVIDTNVLVSAMLKWDSVPGNVMELAFSGTIIPLLNEHILNEYRKVLSRKKFHLTKDIIRDVINSNRKKHLSKIGAFLYALGRNPLKFFKDLHIHLNNPIFIAKQNLISFIWMTERRI